MSEPEIPLELALEVCLSHGLEISIRPPPDPPPPSRPRVKKVWRESFLSAVREARRVTVAAEAAGVSTRTVYREARTISSFKTALDMAIGRSRWNERTWETALEEARAREIPMTEGEKSHDSAC